MTNDKLLTSALEGLAVFTTGMVAGGCCYISGIEVPGRGEETTPAYQLKNWHETVPRARDFFKPFGFVVNAIIGGCIYKTKKQSWWVSFALLGALGPWTAIAIVPTNETLGSLKQGDANDEAQAPDLVKKWGSVHMVRTVLSTLGFVGTIVAMAMD